MNLVKNVQEDPLNPPWPAISMTTALTTAAPHSSQSQTTTPTLMLPSRTLGVKIAKSCKHPIL